MAVTTTARLGVTRWSAGSDPFSRAQMDASHAALEALGAIYGQGTLANRPAAGVVGRYYTVRGDTVANTGRVFYDDGTQWFEVGANLQNATARASAATSVAYTVQGFAGQSSNLQEFRSSTNALLGAVAANGAISFSAGATLGPTTVTTLTASSNATLQGNLSVAGSSTFAAATVTGALKAGSFKSTSTRSSGLAKTELNDDGTGRMDALIPPGFFMASLRATVPAGWLLMNGQTVSVATYSDLWEALGQPGGAGATTFQIPDWRDRTTVGASATKALGSTGGSAQVTLTVNELPPHVHSIAHDHTVAHSHTIAHTHDFAHTHSIAHDHAPFTSAAGGTGGSYGLATGLVDGGQGWMLSQSPGGYADRVLVAGVGYPNDSHGHTIDVPAFSGTSGGASTTTTGASSAANSGTSTPTTSAPSSANSGSAGSGAAFSVQDPYGAAHWVIKT